MKSSGTFPGWVGAHPGWEGAEEYAPMWQERSTVSFSIWKRKSDRSGLNKKEMVLQMIGLELSKNAFEPLKARVPEAKKLGKYFCSFKRNKWNMKLYIKMYNQGIPWRSSG